MNTKPDKKSLTNLALGIAFFGGALAATGQSMPTMPELGALSLDVLTDTASVAVIDSVAYRDSIEIAETARLNAEATEIYKNLKFEQYNGIIEQDLYPKVMDTYTATLAAIAAPRATEEDNTRHSVVLLDISNNLMKGAVYYSSKQNAAEFTRFATSYVDVRMNPLMKNFDFGSAATPVYPSLVYASASGSYNSGNFEKAAAYLKEYITTGAPERRESAYTFLAQASVKIGAADTYIDDLLRGVEEYPANFNLCLLTLQNCLSADETEKMQPVLDKALLLHPNDEQLLNVQARLFENKGNYADALGYFERLYELKPNSLTINQHLALCYYNLGADYYNSAIMESDEKLNKKYMRQATAYFTTAADKLGRIVDNDPTNIKYLQALGKTYGCLGQKENLDAINQRLIALGMTPMKINDMPEAITVDGTNKTKAGEANNTVIPDFQTFSVDYVTTELNDWCKIREFEKMEDFKKRVNEETVLQQHRLLSKEAERKYIEKYAKRFRIADMKLSPYDAENECYKIESTMGEFVIKVPLKNREAEVFKSQWETTQVRDPKYYIKDNHVAIASITLVTSSGKSYSYNSENAIDYDYTPVSVDLGGILAANSNKGSGSSNISSSSRTGRVIRAKSDVDENIPQTTRRADKSLALIIANENYSKVSKVESALQDGETFAEYCRMTLGIPENQVMYYPDITYGDMIDAVDKTRRIVNALGSGVDVIVYYAGHGFPDEASKDAFLLPTDGNGISTASAYSLKKFYSDLANMGADNVMVFLDACFSGVARDGETLVQARGVALKAKPASPSGNMFVLSAASDQETAMPYRDKHHGLFTYYLLKKIQESKGNVSLKDLSEYVETNVKRNSIAINGKLQTPHTSLSGNMTQNWTSKKLRP